MPRCASSSPSATSSTSSAREHEVGLRGQRLEARPGEDVAQRARGGRDLAATRCDRVRRAKTGAARGERDAVDVEGLLDQIEVGDERRVDERVSETQSRKPVQLGEAAKHDDLPPVGDVVLASDAALGRDEVAVGLVDDRDTPLRERVEERRPLVPSERSDPSGCSGHRPRRFARRPRCARAASSSRSKERSSSRTGTRCTVAPRVAEIWA